MVTLPSIQGQPLLHPPEMVERVQQLVKVEGSTMSEFLREAIRLYMGERKWLRRKRRQLPKARRDEQEYARRSHA